MSVSLILKDQSLSADKAADFLAAELGQLKNDALLAYKEHPGFLLMSAELGPASELNKKASAAGLATALVNDEDIAAIPPSVPVTKLEFATAGIFYVAAGARVRLPLEAIRLLTLNALDVETTPIEPEEQEATLLEQLRNRYFPFRVPIKLPEVPKASDIKMTDTIFTCDIITRGPEPVRLTFSHDAFDYSGLGAKKTYASMENLRLLLTDVSALAFKAGRNRLLAAFLKKEPLAPFRNPTAAAYETELRWLLTIK